MPTSSRPTPSAPFRWCSPSTGSPIVPSSWPSVGADRAARRRLLRQSLVPRASWPARWGRAPSSRRSARSPTTTSRPVTRSWRSGSSRAASTCCSSRRSTTCSRARPPSRPAHRAMVRHGRVVPIQAQVTIELTGRMLPGTEIGAALTALSPLGVDVLGLNCATGPVEMYEPLRSLCEAAPDAALVPAQRRTAECRRRPDALRPHARGAGRTPLEVRHRVRRAGRRGLLRHDTGTHRARRRGRAPAHARQAFADARAGRGLDLLGHELPTGPFGATGRRTDQRERVEEVPRRHARRRLGHLRRHRPRPDQRGRAHPRRLRRLHRRRRRRRHERTHESIGHTVVGADHGRHDRDARSRVRRSPGSAARPSSTR